MPTADYRTRDNKRAPGASTIAGMLKESGGLIHWAWKCGMDGLDYRKMRDAAAEAGSVGHILVESAIKHITPVFPTDATWRAGRHAWAAYQKWQEQSRIRWTDAELSLVSEKYRYGGTIDAIGVMDGANTYCLGDWKTGSLYPEHLVQIAAYGQLFEEATGHPIGDYHLIRFNRDTGDFTHFHTADLADAWRAFLLLRELYDLRAQLKKRI